MTQRTPPRRAVGSPLHGRVMALLPGAWAPARQGLPRVLELQAGQGKLVERLQQRARGCFLMPNAELTGPLAHGGKSRGL